MENYINHLGKYANSTAIQAALDAGTLVNPYVAMDSAGTLDFNSLQPTPPAPATMGVWSENTNSFTILENDYQTYWYDPAVYIGTFNGVYFESEEPINMDLYLYYNGSLNFTLKDKNDPYRFDTTSNSFQVGVATSDIFEYTYIDPEESDGNIQIDWDGVDTFTFGSMHGTLSVTKHNPEYPSAVETMGNWSEDGTGGHYFTITEEDTGYWYDSIYIGTLNNVVFGGGNSDMGITLTYSSGWKITIGEGEHSSDRAEQTFEEGTPDNWNTGVMVTAGDSDANIYVEWFGDNTFAFYSGSEINPISITTHDPEYPEGE